MNDVVMDEVIYIDEKSYQQLKEEMCKSDDYFKLDEICVLMKITPKLR